MPTFCRHGRFIERCRICSKDLPGQEQSTGSARRPGAGRSSSTSARRSGAGPARAGTRGPVIRVRRELRAQDDGYRSPLAPGLRASADAQRLAEEIGFASGRLLALAADPPGLYGEARALAGAAPETAIWLCFLTAYLCPLEDGEEWAGIREVLERMPAPPVSEPPTDALDGIPLGPRTSHDPARGPATIAAYVQWLGRAGGGCQAVAIAGDGTWTPERRFERIFERLALPGLIRTARYEFLLLLGRLGLAELRPDSLQLGARTGSTEDVTTAAAKRVFGIAEPLLLDRRARELADAAGVPVESLDLALWNWGAPVRATLGFAPEAADPAAAGLATGALGL
jgi:Alpha-glutamyl/putrescinyl thymine pyrophosphorylase clade 3